MSYAAFLVGFVVIPTLVLLVVGGWRLRRSEIAAGGLVALVALLYTTPWDDAIIGQGVWTYPPDRTLGITIGRVPVEECIFYVVQVAFVGTAWRLWSRWRRSA